MIVLEGVFSFGLSGGYFFCDCISRWRMGMVSMSAKIALKSSLSQRFLSLPSFPMRMIVVLGLFCFESFLWY